MWKTVLKHILATIFFIFSILSLVATIAFAISMINETRRLAADPYASGMEFLLFEPVFIAFSSFIGLICSGAGAKLCTFKVTKIISFVLLMLFCVIMLVGVSMWLRM